MKHLKRLPRGALFGLLAAILTLLVLNVLQPVGRVAVAQDQATLTPTITPTSTPPAPTLTPTPVPALQLQVTVELLPDGDLNGDGIINPGDTVKYNVRLVNTGDRDSGPIEVIFSYDAAFIGGVANISAGGVADNGQVNWRLDEVVVGADLNLEFSATLRGRFPPGRTQVTGAVVVRANGVELARSSAPTLEVLGPNLSLVDVSYELITDATENGRIDPGDTVRFTIAYSNTGGGNSQEASIVADYPDELTLNVVGDLGNAQDADGMLIWNIGSVPPDGETRAVQFTVVLDSEFPSGAISYDMRVTIRSATATLDERMVKVPVAGPNLVLTPRLDFLADADDDLLADPGDLVEVTIQVQNVGTEPASNLVLTSVYAPDSFEISVIGQEGVRDPDAGTISWTLLALDAGASGEVSFQARVRNLPPGLEALQVEVAVLSDQTAAERTLEIPVDAPTPTPQVDGTPGALISETRPPQGQGILSPFAIAALVGTFLFFSLLAIVFVASRVLPGTSEEREALDTPEERQDHRRLVRELIEGVVLTAILFSVMVLGLQNALDRNSINSIIAGIVGYVAGRVSSQR